ncbi:MAG: extracellular solute-binding protein, partial [Xanthobacteraceae bacterium]
MNPSRIIFGLGVAAFLIAGPALPAQRVVNYYNWSDYQDPTVLDEFTKTTGIAVRYDTFDSNDTLEAKLLAGQSGYDVVVPTAYFLARQIKAGIFQKLDKSKLPNAAYLWPEIAKALAFYDPGNQYAVDYMWGTTGTGYNVKDVKQILGPDGKIDSWDYVFDPDKLKKFKDCGIHMLDS